MASYQFGNLPNYCVVLHTYEVGVTKCNSLSYVQAGEAGGTKRRIIDQSSMNVISRPRIAEYQKAFPLAADRLGAWLAVASKAKWQTPEDVKNFDPKTSFVGNGRAIFNIVGGRYRLIVRIDYLSQSIYIRWFGTHQEYDKLDATTV
jgi:mRNA interferase HigB